MLPGSIARTLATLLFLAVGTSAASANTLPEQEIQSLASAGPAVAKAISESKQDAFATKPYPSVSSSLRILSVPVPPSVLLLGSALVGVMALGRRQPGDRPPGPDPRQEPEK